MLALGMSLLAKTCLECKEWPASLWSPVPKFIMCQAGHSLGIMLSGTEGG